MFTRLIPGNVCVQDEGILQPSSTISKESDKKKKQLSTPNTRTKLHWNKNVAAKPCVENFVRFALKENKL